MSEYCSCPGGSGGRHTFRKANWSPADQPIQITVHKECDRPVYSSMTGGALLHVPPSNAWTARRRITFRKDPYAPQR